jgi:hypothetical protein
MTSSSSNPGIAGLQASNEERPGRHSATTVVNNVAKSVLESKGDVGASIPAVPKGLSMESSYVESSKNNIFINSKTDLPSSIAPSGTEQGSLGTDINGLNGSDDSTRLFQRACGLSDSSYEALISDQDSFFLTSPSDLSFSRLFAKDKGTNVSLNLFDLPLFDNQIHTTEEGRYEQIERYKEAGLHILREFNSKDQETLETQITQDLPTKRVLQESNLIDFLARLKELNISPEYIPTSFVDPAPVVAGILVELGLSFRYWHLHLVNPSEIFEYVMDELERFHW